MKKVAFAICFITILSGPLKAQQRTANIEVTKTVLQPAQIKPDIAGLRISSLWAKPWTGTSAPFTNHCYIQNTEAPLYIVNGKITEASHFESLDPKKIDKVKVLYPEQAKKNMDLRVRAVQLLSLPGPEINNKHIE